MPKFKDLKINSQFIRPNSFTAFGGVGQLLYLKIDDQHAFSPKCPNEPLRFLRDEEVIPIFTGSKDDELYGQPLNEADTTEQVHGKPEMCNLHTGMVWLVELLNGDITYDLRVFTSKIKADEYVEARVRFGHKGKVIISEMFLDPEPPKPEGPQYKRESSVSFCPITGRTAVLILKDGKPCLSVHGQRGCVPDVMNEADKIINMLRGNNEVQSASA